MSLSLSDALTLAISGNSKMFSEGDKVKFKSSRVVDYIEKILNIEVVFNIVKVNHFTYDLVLSASEELILKCDKIVNDNFFWSNPSFEVWQRHRKESTEYTDDQILSADELLRMKSLFCVEEGDLTLVTR